MDRYSKQRRRAIALAVVLIATLLAGKANAGVIGQWFSPKGGCTAAIVAMIDAAEVSIDYQMYSFTSRPIADALIRAHKRGVKVTLLLDEKSARTPYSQAARCLAAGIPTNLDGKHPIAHNKVRIFDGRLVAFGSFNDTAQAESSNAEDLVLENDPAVVARFAANFQEHLKHSHPLASSQRLANHEGRSDDPGRTGTIANGGKGVDRVFHAHNRRRRARD